MASFVFATSHEAKQQSTDAMQDQSSSTTSATVVTGDKDSGTFTILSQDGKPLELQASELDFIHLIYEVLSIKTWGFDLIPGFFEYEVKQVVG
jgi:hypothetical protein